MSIDIITRPEQRQQLIEATGEIISLDAGNDELGKHLRNLRTLKNALDSVARAIQDETLVRMAHDATKTVHAGGLVLRAKYPSPEYDGEALLRDLAPLVEAGRFSQAALDRAVEVVPTYKAKAQGLKALEGLGDDIKEIIARHRHASNSRPYIEVGEDKTA